MKNWIGSSEKPIKQTKERIIFWGKAINADPPRSVAPFHGTLKIRNGKEHCTDGLYNR